MSASGKLRDVVRTFFLPGAGGSSKFWKPLSEELGGDSVLFSWPGLGDEIHDESIQSIDALVELVERDLDGPVNVIAQSMGGLVAVLLALRNPHLVQRLVLCVTSAGVKMDQFGASDWRKQYRDAFPNAAKWIEEVHLDLTDQIKTLDIPTLLVWGGNDPISPVAVGQHLESLFPSADLHIIPDGDHDIGATHPKQIARLIKAHFKETP